MRLRVNARLLQSDQGREGFDWLHEDCVGVVDGKSRDGVASIAPCEAP